MTFFYLLIGFIIIERLVELYIAASNEKWMKERGAIEVGRQHYKFFVLLHALFFLCVIIELQYIEPVPFNTFFFSIFLMLQLGRVWCIVSLGKFWNTKVIVLPNVLVIRKGPYKYLKHPNYIIVFFELFTIPAIFGAYFTAILFPMLHLFLLAIRIPIEDEALKRT